ncbi:MAG TPA: FMN-binding protein [Frankiaceae bacterium]|jgi:uncharacterized protein with FMN-binding domain|nr:FMN-binding protein [Frankiaceae bacterium]
MRRVVLAVTSTVAVLVLLLGFKSQSAPPVTKPSASSSGSTGTSGSTDTGSTSTGSGSTGSSSSGSTSSGSSSGSTTGTKTVTGDSADTRYGPVQVKITAVNGKITSVDAIDYPQNDPRDQEINSYAIPQLNQEALAAGTANIDIVSGATYTSDGYVQSLQSALDKLKS